MPAIKPPALSVNAAMVWRLLIILALAIAASPFPAVAAQQGETPTAAIIALEPGEGNDALIAQRIAGIFAQIRQFESLEVSVSSGVVAVSGQVANEAQAQRALQMASRIDGAIAVDDRVVRTLDLKDNLNPCGTRCKTPYAAG